ncbi:uncharacterized protein B0I36DRAFT_270526 [Microdochium trichocladiopsis]|uniref:BZIP domain-containing protein n=1 Tax=Microdochium trichocladiopsis TaxID=1682393 RepID=A0A9P8Y3H7_9PEZI|nr:uncharacterized protein B0I36DRAFT_270526 [Microdochium trichocladiopsis]KAH7029849.1 hypothetical protein B0I36DRAFT_270526 [Microdochium trichocladiopsis]
MSTKDLELERKRARDRRSQQAMRDRNKWTIESLNQQVSSLAAALDEQTQKACQLGERVKILEGENARLRAQSAAAAASATATSLTPQISTKCHEPYELPPFDTSPTCLADEIVQALIATERRSCLATAKNKAKQMALKPNLAALVYKDHKTDDEISNIVGGIIRCYTEIETLPTKVAVFYCMSISFKVGPCVAHGAERTKWLVCLDARTWENLPAWLRPVSCQLQTPHAGWIDRIPWPRAREWLIRHPDITLDVFAVSYSSCLSILWDHDPEHVLIKVDGRAGDGGAPQAVVINPIFEQHLRQLKHWTVGEPFRSRFKELADLIEQDRQDWDR